MDDTIAAIAPELSREIARVMGKTPVSFAPLLHAGGYTQAVRRIVHFSDNTTAFVKVAVSDDTAQWLRTERKMYEALEGASFLPTFLGAGENDGNTCPFLLLEDLSACQWPAARSMTPWSSGKVQAVLDALALVRAEAGRAPVDLPRVENELAGFASWHLVAENPAPLLSLGLCSEKWLNDALPALIDSQNAAPIAGNDLLHLDVRSDNLCFRPDGRAVLVDWNWACLGNGTLDIAGWLPSLHSEGGPAPEAVCPEAGVFAALLAGFWALRAGLPPPPGAARVRVVQKQQLATTLPWAARVLGLPPPQ